jgi:PAS domain S-box-containing protein
MSTPDTPDRGGAPATAVAEHSLPAAPDGPGLARRLVRDFLFAVGHPELTEAAALAVSELATNALLHGLPPFVLRLHGGPGGLHAAVIDASPVRPEVAEPDTERTTGRGVALVQAIATAWGVAQAGEGKAVWFELGDQPPRPLVSPPLPDRADRDRLSVRLVGVAPALLTAAVEHADALLRELELLAGAGAVPLPLQGLTRWNPEPSLLGLPLLAAAREPAEASRPADLVVHLPAAAPAAAVRRLGLLDELDEIAASGLLLTEAALPEVAGVRRWALEEIVAQSSGADPRPWSEHQPSTPDRPRTGGRHVPGDLDLDLDPSAATVVADRSNHILAVTEAVAEMLGWRAADLVGQRLTALIPAQYRQAHLAGYTRLVLTGQSRVLDQDLRLEALHRDGTVLPVAMHITQLPGGNGFRATLNRLPDDTDGGTAGG